MELGDRIAAVRAGVGDPAAMLGEFRRSAVLVPVVGGEFMSAVSGGIRWVYAFTDEAALTRFAAARGEAAREWEYAAVLGARLLDAVVPEWNGPAGVAVDVADEDGSMLFPPVKGIVPVAVAVDATNVTDREGER
ncbi:SseB family protein [Streptomyces sp. NBC_01803]|uniref:SseB family protein n=1 Tax=Streptomyces sp. NBC_01803 TaxID=2975946 RepID=UPI002DDBDD29|nr:SseB family protein [Streptomyces sp. NBC_01803]WSA44081.1 SseB family protein [Streptomyces sp. NBC_01803]